MRNYYVQVVSLLESLLINQSFLVNISLRDYDDMALILLIIFMIMIHDVC